MEQVSYPNFLCQSYIVIIHECPPWNTRHPPPNATAPPSQSHVKFTFSCESHYMEWVESEDSPPHVLSQYSHLEADKSITLILEQLLNDDPTQIMARELRELPLTFSQLASLIGYALEQARRDVASVPPYDYVLDLYLHVDVRHKHRMWGTRDSVMSRVQAAALRWWGVRDSVMSRVMQESFDAAALMVPAAEAAVEMVMREKVELNGMETCTICLEEVGEGVRMPCSHVFHGGCIGGWLRINHRCPLCRFEMPVAAM